MIKLLEAVNRKAFGWCFKKRKYDFISQLMADWHTQKSRRETTDRKCIIKLYQVVLTLMYIDSV